MKSLKDIQKLIKKFDIKPRSEMRSKVLEDALKLQMSRNRQRTSDMHIWRIIMHSKMTKYVSATMVFFAVFISMQFLPGTELNAAQLLTKVSKNMRNTCVRSVTKNYPPGQETPSSEMTSVTDYRNKQVFLIYSKGYIHHLDYKTMIHRIYRSEDNMMIVSGLKGEWMDLDIQIKEYIEKLSQEGLEIHQSELLNNNVQLTVIEYDEVLNNISVKPDKYMSKMMMGNKMVKRIHTKLTVNRDELYLSQAEVSYYDSQDNLIITKETKSAPINIAPTDIYELGVPADATVINKVPDERVKEVRDLIKQNQSQFLKDYVAIQLEYRVESDGIERMIEGMVIYSKGKKLRVDVFRRQYPSDKGKDIDSQIMVLLYDSTMRMQPYVSQAFRPRAIRIYDGLWQNKLEEHEGKFVLRKPHRRPDGDEYGDDDLDDFGWRTLWWLNEPEWMYEDSFSKENNLLAMELTAQGGLRQLPKRLTLYVDPAKDYLYRRYIEEELVDAPWQIDRSWFDSVKNKDRLEEEVRVYDVIEYGQTSEGQWYPKTITIKGYDNPLRKNVTTNDINRISRIYLLEENPDLPDELFDPKQLSALDAEKQ